MTLSIIAFTLEAFGFWLNFVEVRYPYKAKRIENTIDGLQISSRNWADHVTRTVFFQVVLSFAILAVLLVDMGWLVTNLSPVMDDLHFPWMVWFLVHGTVITFLIMTGAYFVSDFVKWLNAFSPHDQAMSSLGLFIASIGLTINLIQIIQDAL